MTVPLAGVPLSGHRPVYDTLAESGFTDLWSAEVAGADAFTPLALAAAWRPELRLGTAVVPVSTRGPGLLATLAAALAEAAPGRFVLGIGASSPVVVTDWNTVQYDQPYARSRDMLRFLRAALEGETVDHEYETFTVRRFTLERPPAIPPAVLLAALRPRMLRLAGAEADGVILNWLAPADVPTVLAETGRSGQDFEVAARVFVCPTEDARHARALGRQLIATYLTVPAYAEFHRWLGRTEALAPVWEASETKGRRAAAAAVPDELVDELIVHGSPEHCREAIHRYVQAGVHTPILALLPTSELADGGAAALTRLIPRLAPVPPRTRRLPRISSLPSQRTRVQ